MLPANNAQPWSAQRLYRPYVVAALVIGVFLGFATGAGILVAIALGYPTTLQRLAHSQAHGISQLFGWAGLFVMGVAYHVVPRFRNHVPSFPWPQRVTLALVLAGVILRFIGQPATFV